MTLEIALKPCSSAEKLRGAKWSHKTFLLWCFPNRGLLITLHVFVTWMFLFSPSVCFLSSRVFKSHSQLLITFPIVLQVLKPTVPYVPDLHKPAEKLSSQLSHPQPCGRCLQRPLSVKADRLSNYTSIPNSSLPY